MHTLSIDLLHSQTFESYDDLIASVGVQLTDLSESTSPSDTVWLDKILGAHPRLGEKKVESVQSQAEQAQLNTGGEEEASKLRQLNAEYEKTFPGLIYVYDVAQMERNETPEADLLQRLRKWEITTRDHGRYASQDR